MVAPKQTPKVFTNGEYMTVENGHTIQWWKSKKFVGYMWGDITWKLILVVMLAVVANENGGVLSGAWLTILFTVIVTAGVAQMGFLGGQAWIDRYTQAIRIPAEMGASILSSAAHAIEEELDGDPEPAPELPDLPPVDIYLEEKEPGNE